MKAIKLLFNLFRQVLQVGTGSKQILYMPKLMQVYLQLYMCFMFVRVNVL